MIFSAFFSFVRIDYPLCDNSLLHGVPAVVRYEPVPEIPATFVGPHVYPPGVHPSACPNYPFCNSVSKIVLPLPGFTERLYPPGVHPSACPNYPEC